jgi:nucleoside-diphosphate-sugar epimerase
MPVDLEHRVLVAGAGGVVGRRLCRLLLDDGWHVIGTTRSSDRAAELRALGVEPVIVDVYNADALSRVVVAAEVNVVVHQLTDLPPGLDPSRMAEARKRNARLREVGTRNLVAAAVAGGAKRLIAQSVAFAYAPGTIPYREDSPLNVAAEKDVDAMSARAVASLEQQVLGAQLVGIVLRYGRLYGPGTGFDGPAPGGPLHVDAAADAARRAMTRGTHGVYNIAQNDGTVSSAKAQTELGWRDDFRIA